MFGHNILTKKGRKNRQTSMNFHRKIHSAFQSTVPSSYDMSNFLQLELTVSSNCSKYGPDQFTLIEYKSYDIEVSDLFAFPKKYIYIIISRYGIKSHCLYQNMIKVINYNRICLNSTLVRARRARNLNTAMTTEWHMTLSHHLCVWDYLIQQIVIHIMTNGIIQCLFVNKNGC